MQKYRSSELSCCKTCWFCIKNRFVGLISFSFIFCISKSQRKITTKTPNWRKGKIGNHKIHQANGDEMIVLYWHERLTFPIYILVFSFCLFVCCWKTAEKIDKITWICCFSPYYLCEKAPFPPFSVHFFFISFFFKRNLTFMFYVFC